MNGAGGGRGARPSEWVAHRLGVRTVDGEAPGGVRLGDLVGLAVRRNPRRAHLLVSGVLGKHVPADPRIVHGAGLLLGELVRLRLRGREGSAGAYGPLLANALHGTRGSAAALRDRLREPKGAVDAVVIGYAETATALGHSAADALGGARYLHSTRRQVPGVVPYGGFEEEHSHATGHLLLPADHADLDREVPLVLVDDEMSTGRTAFNTLRALHAVRPREHYVLASLVDVRGEADRVRMRNLAGELGARIDVVTLATGRVELPPGVLDAAQNVVAELSGRDPEIDYRVDRGAVRVELGWPAGLPDGGRHGFAPADRRRLDKELPRMASILSSALPADARRVLVLGTEEFMYVPLRVAEALADALPWTSVRFSTTTRSPVLAVDDPGYAIRTRLVFPAHDNPTDGPGKRYAYNVHPGNDAARGFDAFVLLVDERGDTPDLVDGLLGCLRTLAPVVLAAVPGPGR
ncbi:phosphoribosyltransferase family protein [Actinomadura atramentaria]|uniref:phosphoribosyltransferase family protein n=1 Tax=Actinomadura atramentaria TaxID=1990 RepID=UPI0003636525|nr:phosphoribosyltransferase family protein [Actinomadura atramentaria]